MATEQKKKDMLTTRTIKTPLPGDKEALFSVTFALLAPAQESPENVLTQAMAAVATRGFSVVYNKHGKVDKLTRDVLAVKGEIGTTRMQLLGLTQYKLSKKDTTIDVLELESIPHPSELSVEPLARLTKPQIEMLLKSAKPNGTYAVTYYTPGVKLKQLGLIDSGADAHFSAIWHATEKGKQWLKAKGLIT